MAGVLVLIEQYHLVPGPLGGAHLGVAHGDLRREPDLVPVVEHLAGPLGRGVAVDERQQLLPGPLGFNYLAHPGEAPAWPPRRLGVQPLPHAPHVIGRPQVLGEVAREVEHRRGHGLRRPLHLVHRPVVGGHDRHGELPGKRGRDQPHRRLKPLTERVVADQAARVGVVGADHRLARPRARLVVGRAPCEAGAAQRVEAQADPFRELGRGLPGERQAKYPVGADHAVGDQPHEPRGHRLALA